MVCWCSGTGWVHKKWVQPGIDHASSGVRKRDLSELGIGMCCQRMKMVDGVQKSRTFIVREG